MKSITVVGASLAGLYAARALRTQGFDGRLVIVGDEHHQPYDRPPLSKDFLTGATDQGQLALVDADDTADLYAEWYLGTRATGLDAAGGTVLLDGDRSLETDAVVIATGATPRLLPGQEPGDPAHTGVHTLRTLDDAQALREDLARGQARVVVIGGGFIGAEVASSCAMLGHDVTVVEAAPLPLVPQLGDDMAKVCAGLHADHGVTLVAGTGVAGLQGGRGYSHHPDSPDRVTGVELTDGRLLPADIVVVGIGVRPNTDWLESSGLLLKDGVVCDAGCVGSLPNVVAVGDVARVDGHRAEHWTSATEQAGIAAQNLLAGSTVATHRSLPYFWSDQYGVRIQFAGRRLPTDTPRIVEGSADARSFLACYERDGQTTAVLAVNRPRPFMRYRRELKCAV
ncbi:FAD-dependent oxidoreductase [Streptomyces sp. A73]|uniref:NAD(P)/FAD-dependent oxidoreductase n=1 Tax=Streptomyces sp. RK75 TaxID=2824895 RepID=UPI001B388B6B|nr:FAD-dependent oxidoreductase [Streptomyces sp. RK75]MBQ0862204.1 FAD-dependent oxidoreductase [Streptomyces sp. RK75]MBQ1157655.1 FAD-dependent oxidoreductase [Streptomyces sp. A73]